MHSSTGNDVEVTGQLKQFTRNLSKALCCPAWRKWRYTIIWTRLSAMAAVAAIGERSDSPLTQIIVEDSTIALGNWLESTPDLRSHQKLDVIAMTGFSGQNNDQGSSCSNHGRRCPDGCSSTIF